jgi:hypothetical protein
MSSNIYDVRVMGGCLATCSIASTGAGVIAAGTNTTAFVDNLNVATVSGVIQTNANSTAPRGGLVANGEQLTLFGLQISIFSYVTATGVSQALPVIDCQELITKCSIEINAKGTPFNIGPANLYPSAGKGAYSPGSVHAANGSPDAPSFRLPAAMPLQLESQDQFSARVIVDTAMPAVTAASNFNFQFYFPATRAYTFRSLGGA